MWVRKAETFFEGITVEEAKFQSLKGMWVRKERRLKPSPGLG